ncbi:histidine kinase [Paenibacillus sp. sptzw28]|uniref:phage tail tube protein n=1 Tax=Paenibacillus sp. sptzw28 TaxID=715179 RepID=UPI001C6EBD2A|nr:phage tail tube protein [Paenibacillus sp. sptzw28]QYR20801.1 histidine kinase [Paenibacillus sp. sptzw28]
MPQRSVGTKIKIGTTYIAQLTSIDAPPRTAETLDTTTLDSAGGYRTFTGGFKDGGEITISGFFEPGDAGQDALNDAFEAGALQDFQVLFPSEMGASWTFRGVVTAFQGGSATLEDLLSFEATIKISGSPTLATSDSGGLTALALSGGGTLAPVFANGTYYYAYTGAITSPITVTATAASHTLKLYIDGVYSQDLTSGSASNSIAVALNTSKKLTITAQEASKSVKTYEIIVNKSS